MYVGNHISFRITLLLPRQHPRVQVRLRRSILEPTPTQQPRELWTARCIRVEPPPYISPPPFRPQLSVFCTGIRIRFPGLSRHCFEFQNLLLDRSRLLPVRIDAYESEPFCWIPNASAVQQLEPGALEVVRNHCYERRVAACNFVETGY